MRQPTCPTTHTGAAASALDKATAGMRRRALLAGGVLLALAGCAAPAPVALDPDTKLQLARIQQYLNSVHTLRASVLQEAPNGDVTQGVVWMDRPGRLRLQDDPPSQVTLIAADGQVLLYDGATGATTRMPLARTPLAMLLAPQITLSGPVTVTAFQHLPGELRVTIVDTKHPGQGSLTLTFQDNPIALRDVRMVDARGNTNRLMLRTVQTGITPPPGLFRLSSNVAS
ncbi:MAG TPA: outer membrane lipoprotein carrier protein LolA [Rhodopila sp.]|nr:outer membrane lipoprotein carrier protein LolA [Rhodopila sp.]